MNKYVVSLDGDIWAVKYEEALEFFRENIDEECEYETVSELVDGEGLEVRTEIVGYVNEYGDEVDTWEMFDEFLDSYYDYPEIMGVTVAPSAFVSEFDPIAYETGLHDYVDNLEADNQLFECWEDFHEANN